MQVYRRPAGDRYRFLKPNAAEVSTVSQLRLSDWSEKGQCRGDAMGTTDGG